MLLSNLVEHWAWLRFGLAALHVVAVVLLVAVAMAWARHGRRWLLIASGVITVSVITFVYLVTVRPSDIPVDWITILTHGLEGKSIMHLSTRGVNAGASFAFVVSAAAAGPVSTLHDVVWLNLLLALVNAVIFLHVAVYVTGPRWALPWTAAFALNPATFMASFSELPTNVLAVYFLAGVVAWAVVNDPLAQPRMIRTAAYALCAILTVLTALTRIEVASIGAIALALHGGHALLGPERWSAAGRRLRKAGEWPLSFFSNHPAAVAVLCVAGWWLAQAGLPGVGRDEVAGLYPFNTSILGVFVFLPMLALPIGVSVAVLFGVRYAVVHLRRFGGLVLSLLIVVRAYFAGQDSYHEMARYLSYVLPAILLLGLFGQEHLYEMARRDWRPNWCRAARIGYLMAWCTLPLPGVPEFFMRPEYHRGDIVSQLLLDLNTQREVRYLVAVTENNPQCVFIGRVVEDRGDFRVAPEYDYVVFGKPVAQPVFVPEKDAPLQEVIARHASGAPCVRLYYGGDCNVRFGDHCNQFIAGRRRIDEERFWSRPYNNNPFDYADGAPEIVLATYDWP